MTHSLVQKAEILLNIRLNQTLFADPKRIRLLQEIDRVGSISQAAKKVKVSYKSAWDHLEEMNSISPKPIFNRSSGGRNGGGTQLTAYGKRLLQLYALLEKTQERAFSVLIDEGIPLDSLLNVTAQFSFQTSARNQLFGQVMAITHQREVEVQVEGLDNTIMAKVTSYSVNKLALEVGREVMLLIKAPWVQVHSYLGNVKLGINEFIGTVIYSDAQEIHVNLRTGITLCASLTAKQNFRQGDIVQIHILPEQIMLATMVSG